MNRLPAMVVVLLVAWCLWGTSAVGQVPSVPGESPARVVQWPTERVEMRSGRICEGLVESKDDTWVHLHEIRRPPGRPMYVVTRPIEKASIAKVVRLEPAERAKLRERIDQFIDRARIEAARRDAIRLGIVTKEGNHYQHYRGRWFTLDSTVTEPITRQIIVRIEQIFTAYRQILAPRTESPRPLRLVVFGSMGEYETFLKRLGIATECPACFFQDDNLVVAGSELARFAAQLAKINAQHDQLSAELDRLEKELSDRLAEVARQLRKQGLHRKAIVKLLLTERRKFDQQIDEKRKELERCNRENARVFNTVTRQMFVRLYHEAFHAYLENYVYPHGDYDVPRWLNEGLAMVCEGGLLESDTLRIDAPNCEALKRLKADLDGGQPWPLEELLRNAQGSFLPPGDGADRQYVYSWGLAYYLTFEQHLLRGPAMDGYVQPPAENTSPAERFEKLVGMPLAKFEKQWRDYVSKLR